MDPTAKPRVTVTRDAPHGSQALASKAVASGGVGSGGVIAVQGAALHLDSVSRAKRTAPHTRPRERRSAPGRTRSARTRGAASSSRDGPSDESEGDGEDLPSPGADHRLVAQQARTRRTTGLIP